MDPLARGSDPCEDPARCVVGRAVLLGIDPLSALAEAVDEQLYRGVRPSLKPLTRAEAVAAVLARSCARHRARTATLLASISPTGTSAAEDSPA